MTVLTNAMPAEREHYYGVPPPCDGPRADSSDRVCVGTHMYEKLDSGIGIMHPLPRGPEISPDIDERTDGARILYYEQMKNGVWVRMALLHSLLK